MLFKNVEIDWPLDTNTIRKNSLSHTFGMVRKNADGSPRAHQGWDLYAKEGTAVYAIADGQVEYASTRAALGLLLVTSIGDTGYYSTYAHLKSILVKPGEYVKRGQLVGFSGNTGNAENMKGPDEHLHLEIRTAVLTGLGLTGRISPLQVFGVCPLKKSEYRQGSL